MKPSTVAWLPTSRRRLPSLLDEGARGLGVEVLAGEHGVDLLLGAQRRHLGPLLLEDVEVDPHAGKRREDVREQDDAVSPVRVPRLERDLGRDVGDLAALTEGRVRLDQVAVHLHVPDACRIIHTGGRSTFSPRAARSSSGTSSPTGSAKAFLELVTVAVIVGLEARDTDMCEGRRSPRLSMPAESASCMSRGKE